MSKTAVRTKRYNMTLPEPVYDELQAIADRRGTTVVDVLRGFIKLGFLAVEIEDTPGSSLILREGDREQRLVLI